jgi:DMSO reductase anchor subunit
MNPAKSVVAFTTLIGAGQGLFLSIYVADLFAMAAGAPRPTAKFLALCAVVAVVLSVAGLAASFFHLGHPERAWRAAAMWRTSWLSREVIALPLYIALCAGYALAQYQAWATANWIGALALMACAGLYLCTARIYMCLKFLQEWASPLTLLNFVLLGAASGCTLAVPFAASEAPMLRDGFSLAAIVLTLAAMAARLASLARNARLRPKSSLQSAIGVSHPKIRQTTQGFTGSSFNTREFFHGATAQKMRAVKWSFLILVFPVPVLLIAVGGLQNSALLMAAAFPLQYLGLLAERWYFFAEANHPQNLYYQAIA